MGFALIRIPRYQALPKGALGFCVFGNVAITARYAQHLLWLKCVFIIDFDVHHGNGTNDTFYADPDGLFSKTYVLWALYQCSHAIVHVEAVESCRLPCKSVVASWW